MIYLMYVSLDSTFVVDKPGLHPQSFNQFVVMVQIYPNLTVTGVCNTKPLYSQNRTSYYFVVGK